VIFHGDLLSAVGGVAAASVARQVRVTSKVLPQWPVVLVTVLRMLRIALPQVSLAVGGSKDQGLPHSTILFTDAGDGRRSVIFHGDLLSAVGGVPQASVARQVRVTSKVLPQWPVVLVTVLNMLRVALRRCRWRWADQGPGTAALDDLVARAGDGRGV